MINDFDDFVHDAFGRLLFESRSLLFFNHPSPKPEGSDSELLVTALIGECQGWNVDTEMLSYWEEHRDLFPTDTYTK